MTERQKARYEKASIPEGSTVLSGSDREAALSAFKCPTCGHGGAPAHESTEVHAYAQGDWQIVAAECCWCASEWVLTKSPVGL